MKRSRFTQEQIIDVLKERQAMLDVATLKEMLAKNF